MKTKWATLRVKKRPKESLIIAFLVGFVLFSSAAQGVTLKLVENKCTYDKIMDKDFCRSVYEVSDVVAVEQDKILFYFNTEKEIVAEKYLSNINYKILTTYSGKLGKYIDISAFKNPFKNVDNVPCYDTKCFYEYAWWNSTFPYKYNITGRAYSGINQTDFFLVNDSYINFNLSNHIIWCNYTVKTVNVHELVGYFYIQDNDTYACVDITETKRVDMLTEEMDGGENYNAVMNASLVYWGNMSKNGADQSNYHWAYTTIGTPFVSGGKVGLGMGFNDDYFNYSYHNEHNGSPSISLGGWMKFNESTVPISKGRNAPACGWEIYYGSPTVYCSFHVGTGWLQPSYAISNNIWYNIYCTFNKTHGNLYINGILMDSDPGAGADVITACTGAQPSLIIGGGPDDTDGMKGQLDDIRVYNSTLSGPQIMNIYNNTIGNHSFLILGSLIYNESALPPSTPAIPENITLNVSFTECFGDDYLLINEKCGDQCGFTTYLKRCNIGCANETILGLGNPGCKENDFLLYAIAIIMIIIFAIFIRWWTD